MLRFVPKKGSIISRRLIAAEVAFAKMLPFVTLIFAPQEEMQREFILRARNFQHSVSWKC